MPVLFYNNGYKPAKCQNLVNAPPYTFGWIVPKVDIFIALNPDREPLATRLLSLREKMEDRVYARWGVERDPKYIPSVPEFDDFDDDHIRITLACNDSDEMIDEIMADKAFHDECRDCFNNPKSMAMEPVWILSAITRVPKGLYVPMESLPEPTKLPSFPKFYNNGAKPAKQGEVDHAVQWKTPHYIFGWIVPKADIFIALNPGQEPLPPFFLLWHKMRDCIHSRWRIEKDPKYYPPIPEVENFDEDYFLIKMAWNESNKMIDEIMADKAYHDECRKCFNNPASMAIEPAWILLCISRVPRGLLPE